MASKYLNHCYKDRTSRRRENYAKHRNNHLNLHLAKARLSDLRCNAYQEVSFGLQFLVDDKHALFLLSLLNPLYSQRPDLARPSRMLEDHRKLVNAI